MLVIAEFEHKNNHPLSLYLYRRHPNRSMKKNPEIKEKFFFHSYHFSHFNSLFKYSKYLVSQQKQCVEQRKNQLHLCHRIGSLAESRYTCNAFQLLILLLLFFMALSENILRSFCVTHRRTYIHIILEWNILNKKNKRNSVSVATTKALR